MLVPWKEITTGSLLKTDAVRENVQREIRLVRFQGERFCVELHSDDAAFAEEIGGNPSCDLVAVGTYKDYPLYVLKAFDGGAEK